MALKLFTAGYKGWKNPASERVKRAHFKIVPLKAYEEQVNRLNCVGVSRQRARRGRSLHSILRIRAHMLDHFRHLFLHNCALEVGMASHHMLAR
jgi:hypothetical protein